ncbi:hypothetical protein FACS1894151_03320 [Spirochaetia bacterium]|nr:hypothetical protein FACS1894151_03320 [Spirochaetia bacterium]
MTLKKILKGIIPYGIIWIYKNHKEEIVEIITGGGYYDHILSLYPNCEPAFQFQRYFGFVESSLFTWCASQRFAGFIESIKNPNKIFSNGIIPHLDWNNMLECKETGLNFHGNLANKELLDENGKYDDKKIEIEYANVISRVKHLVEKLKIIWNSNDTQLYILACNEFEHRFECSDIDQIYRILKEKTKYVSLLVIIQREDLYRIARSHYISNKNIIVKKIGKWTPVDKVTTVELSDEKGWKRIFRCIKTQSLDQEGKKYKFNK